MKAIKRKVRIKQAKKLNDQYDINKEDNKNEFINDLSLSDV